MIEFILVVTLSGLWFLAGVIFGGIGYQRGAEKEADGGILKLGTKFYKTEPLKMKKDA